MLNEDEFSMDVTGLKVMMKMMVIMVTRKARFVEKDMIGGCLRNHFSLLS